MSDLTVDILPELEAYRLPDFDLGADFIYPNYAGRSILNIPSSVCQLLDVPGIGAQPLTPATLEPLGEGVRRVVLILMDALALHRLQRWVAEGEAPVWQKLEKDGLLTGLTSISPSTTAAAMTTLWSGRSPAEHGVLGYEMWLREYGVVANMIKHAPISFRSDSDSLQKAGFRAEQMHNFPLLGPHLREHGVKPYSFQHYSIVGSGLSRSFLHDVEVRAFGTPAEMWVSARQMLEEQLDERIYLWSYWGAVDGLSHIYGPDDERVRAEFAAFSAAFERNFLERLSPQARRDTVVILTADHGQITTRKDPHYELASHPDLARRLHINPTGENRLMYLFVRPGQVEAVCEYFEHKWPNQFTVFDPEYALESGLFGPGEAHPRARERLGDLIVAARGDAYLWWSTEENPLIGRHGGLHPEEMLVPFLAARLD